MKHFTIYLTCLLFIPFQISSQSRFYSRPVAVTDQYLRDSTNVLARLDLEFPEDGRVFVQFDGEGFGDTLDRIILAANNYPDWDTDDGNVSFVSNEKGEGNCFSHTRTFDVTAGPHSFYAVAHNYVDIGGSGIATIFGNLSVEYIPVSTSVLGEFSINTDAYEVLAPIAYDSVTIETTGPGKVEVRLNGNLDVQFGDLIMVGVSDTKSWDYTDPKAMALESTASNEYYVGFSTTQVFTVPSAGSYTFYAMAQRAYEEEGNGYIYAYTNLHARYYPASSDHVVVNRNIDENNLVLGDVLTLLDSIELNVTKPGKVQVRFDGEFQSGPGHDILLSVNNHAGYDLQTGSIILQSFNEDIDRHPFVHTLSFDIEPGTHTYYVMAENHNGTGSTTIDVNGNFLVKFFPETLVATEVADSDLPFEVWPNPVQDRFMIQMENAHDFLDATIFDSQGRFVMQANDILPGDEINVASLPAGVYMLQVGNRNESGARKLVKE